MSLAAVNLRYRPTTISCTWWFNLLSVGFVYSIIYLVKVKEVYIYMYIRYVLVDISGYFGYITERLEICERTLLLWKFVLHLVPHLLSFAMEANPS